MNKKPIQSKTAESKAAWWIGFFTLLITIYFNSKVQDPFNAPKFWVLLIGASWLIGFLFKYISDTRKILDNEIQLSAIFLLVFFLFLTASLVVAQNRQIAFFGDNMRKNGYLSYIALGVFFIVSAMYIKISNLVTFYKFILITAFVVGGYGMLQISGNDFIPWSSSGMAIFSTFGNSNFAGSAMAILAIIMLGGSYSYRKNTILAATSFLAFILLIITIFPTNARQGLLLLFFGLGSLLIVLIYNYNKTLGRASIIFAFVGFIFSILGMLQIGPLEKLLYKDSVSVRGYYWRAGINMFRDNLWFGVGLDNYGTFFKQYREVGYPLKYGYSLTSTNAHNVFIQQFATGGLFVGLSFISLTLFIFWRGISSMKNFSGDDRFIRAIFFISWLAFQGQSLISIDNIGISIWGWVLSGVVVGLSKSKRNDNLKEFPSNKANRNNSSNLELLQPLISVLFIIPTLILVLFLYRGEAAIFKLRASYNPSIPAQKPIFYDQAMKTINTPLIDLQNKVMTAGFMNSMGYKQESISLLENLLKEDPNSLDALTFLASYYEVSGEILKANAVREKLSILDPWNANNYLQLAFNFKYIGDKLGQQKYLDIALSFASNDPMVIKSKPELIQ